MLTAKRAFSTLKTISAQAATKLDQDLMSKEGGFSIDQLMELAGLSVAQAGKLKSSRPVIGRSEVDSNGVAYESIQVSSTVEGQKGVGRLRAVCSFLPCHWFLVGNCKRNANISS